MLLAVRAFFPKGQLAVIPLLHGQPRKWLAPEQAHVQQVPALGTLDGVW